MSEQWNIGIYGKMPAHGDFLNHNLPRVFLDSWDHWLQQSILASQEALADSWLEYFLISPVWRFVLPSKMINEHSWAGILLPSVDRVGRYYPLSLIARVPLDVGVCEFMQNAKPWFHSLEAVAMAALENSLDISALKKALDSCTLPDFGKNRASPIKLQHQSQYVLPLEEDAGMALDNPIVSVMPLLCDSLLESQSANVSMWWTEGGEHVGPAFLLADKFPRPTSFTAMLNGHWPHWHWPALLHPKAT